MNFLTRKFPFNRVLLNFERKFKKNTITCVKFKSSIQYRKLYSINESNNFLLNRNKFVHFESFKSNYSNQIEVFQIKIDKIISLK